MSVLQRLLGKAERQQPDQAGGDGAVAYERMPATITVADVDVPAVLTRETGTDNAWRGIDLLDPTSGLVMRRSADLPAPLLAAGARLITAWHGEFYADSGRDEFGIGRSVRLVPHAMNVDPSHGMHVRSADGRLMGGWVPFDDCRVIASVTPMPTVGLVIGETWTGHHDRRMELRVLAGPAVNLALPHS
jgi:hypothetical protein